MSNYWTDLQYDAETGAIRNARLGKVLGAWDGRYLRIFVEGERYSAHRLAWFLHYGSWPRYTIDHINRNTRDNRISNLRDVPHAINACNVSRGASGVIGVYSHPSGGWLVSRQYSGKQRQHGYFASRDDAVRAACCVFIDYYAYT